MGDLVHIDLWKLKRLERLEDEWDVAMSHAERLQKDGKFQFAKPFLDRAKELRVAIDKFRGPVPKQREFDWGAPMMLPSENIIYTFSQDLGNFLGRDPPKDS